MTLAMEKSYNDSAWREIEGEHRTRISCHHMHRVWKKSIVNFLNNCLFKDFDAWKWKRNVVAFLYSSLRLSVFKPILSVSGAHLKGHYNPRLWVMSQQRQNSNSDNFGSSNARVSERDFWYSLQVLFLIELKKLTDKNSWSHKGKINSCAI